MKTTKKLLPISFLEFLDGLILISSVLYLVSPIVPAGARALPPDASLLHSPPLPSPLSSPISPHSSTVAALSPYTLQGSEPTKMGDTRRLILTLVVACASVGLIIFSLLVLWIYRYKTSRGQQKNHKKSSDADGKGALSSTRTNGKMESRCIDYKLLETSTENFKETNELGGGEFGYFYKAQLEDNCYAAVKKLKGEGQDVEKEFENEVHLLSKIHHPNITTLLGYCIHGSTRFIVYELMENGPLESQLHGQSGGSAMTWHIRMKIALDIAKGLEHLHEHCNPPVIHRDLKSSSILLDSNFKAKISGFGFAVAGGSQNKKDVKLSGTLCYVAPEYLLDGKLTDKSDVYAFGMVLLELLLGRKLVEKPLSTHCQSLVTWAMPQLTDRSKLPNIVDPAIKDTMDLKHLYQVAAVAVLCVQPEPSYRPLITDVMHSLVPLVPVELGGTLRVTSQAASIASTTSSDPQLV